MNGSAMTDVSNFKSAQSGATAVLASTGGIGEELSGYKGFTATHNRRSSFFCFNSRQFFSLFIRYWRNKVKK